MTLADLNYSVEDLRKMITCKEDKNNTYLFFIEGELSWRYRCHERKLVSTLQSQFNFLAHSLVENGKEKRLTRQKVEEEFKKEACNYLSALCFPEGNADSRG